MTKLIRFFAACLLLALAQLATPALAGGGPLTIAIQLNVSASPTPAAQPVIVGSFTYGIVCTPVGEATTYGFASPAATATFTSGNGTAPITNTQSVNSNGPAFSFGSNNCTVTQLSRPAAPTGFNWVGSGPSAVILLNVSSFIAPQTAAFSNPLAEIPVDGVCGSANNIATSVAPSANLCSPSAAATVTSSPSQFTWSCPGNSKIGRASCRERVSLVV